MLPTPDLNLFTTCKRIRPATSAFAHRFRGDRVGVVVRVGWSLQFDLPSEGW